jgi:hypothetical protein
VADHQRRGIVGREPVGVGGHVRDLRGARVITEHGREPGATATFNQSRTHRYSLRRWISLDPDRVLTTTIAWVMLNPSTADAFKLDPTIKRCAKFSQRWGFGQMIVVNLFGLRSPHPKDLLWPQPLTGRRALLAHAIAPLDELDGNDEAIEVAAMIADTVVCAWGNHGALGERDIAVRRMLARRRTMQGVQGARQLRVVHLGLSIQGQPKHPLARGLHRIPDDVEPIDWKELAL